jgi:allantoinase
MFDLVIRGDAVLAEQVIPDAYLAVRDGRIAAIGTGAAPPARQTEDFSGHLLFPGLVDAQTHAGSHKGLAGLADTTRAAAAGGVTTIVDMPFDEPVPLDDLETLQAKVDKIAEVAVIDVALYATAKKQGDVAAHLRDVVGGGVAGIKLSTYEYHPTRFPRFSTGEMYRVFLEAAALGVPVAFHNEDQELVAHFLAEARAKGDTSAEAYGRSRPPMAERVANAQILELASHTGVRCHIVHSSIPDGVDLVRRYRAQGHDFTVETCLQYLVFTDDDVARQGAYLKQNPPLRSKESREALWARLADDAVDMVSTDHVAWPESRKSDPDIFKNGSGMPGLETLLPAFYTEAVARGFAPTLIARMSSLKPARHFGFYPRKGVLQPGADADVAVFRLGPTRFDQAGMTSEVKWTPFNGRDFAGRVAATFVRGQKVYDGKSVVARAGHGQFLRPDRAASAEANP